jgi:hypothetical protein
MSEWAASIMTSDRHRQRSSDRRRNRRAGPRCGRGRSGAGGGIPHVSNKYPLPVFYLTRGGMGLCVRPHRYALALRCGLLAAGVLGLHECDNPVCVKVAADGDVEHVVAGSQGDNMERMARMRRGGGRYWCAAVTVAVCGESGQWRCGKRCDTAGMRRRLKRRCLAINRLCGEFPSVTLTRDAAVRRTADCRHHR